MKNLMTFLKEFGKENFLTRLCKKNEVVKFIYHGDIDNYFEEPDFSKDSLQEFTEVGIVLSNGKKIWVTPCRYSKSEKWFYRIKSGKATHTLDFADSESVKNDVCKFEVEFLEE